MVRVGKIQPVKDAHPFETYGNTPADAKPGYIVTASISR